MLTTRATNPASRCNEKRQSTQASAPIAPKKIGPKSLAETQAKRMWIDASVCITLALGSSFFLLTSGEFANLIEYSKSFGIGQGNELLLSALPISLAAILFSVLRWNAQKKLIQYIRETSFIDDFTGIINRQGMENFLQEELQRSERYKVSPSVLLIDLDNLRSINDLYGHRVGDRIIQHTASLLNKQVRGPDKVGRLDGEEFMIILPETSLDQAELAAERIHQCILDNPLMDDGEAVIVSASIGVAGGDNTDADQLFYHADQALAIAKQHGKNQVHRWKTH